MRIAIVGGGAMGCLYAGLLAGSGQDVLLVVRRPETQAYIKNQGIRIDSSDGTSIYEVNVMTADKCRQPVDLIVILVKTTDTRSAMISCKALVAPETWVMTLQNGLGNAEILENYVDKNQIIVGTTSHGSALLGPGHIRHNGNGPTIFGPYGTIASDKLSAIKAVLDNAGFPAVIEENVLRQVWQKLFVNVAINPLTALSEIPNGALLNSENSRMVMKSLVEEAVAVAAHEGYIFDPNDVYQLCLDVAEKTSGNLSSMLQDIRAVRATEIGSLNGRVADLGEMAGIPVPCNRLITQLIRVREQTNSDQSRLQP